MAFMGTILETVNGICKVAFRSFSRSFFSQCGAYGSSGICPRIEKKNLIENLLEINILQNFVNSLLASAIVFVHIGDELPKYAPIAIQQARAFNPDHAIYMISSLRALSRLQINVHKIPYETLTRSQEHSDYLIQYPHPGYWRYVVERFFYLDEFLMQYDLDRVIHLENDVMIYFELEKMLSAFNFYSSVGGTFLNDGEGVPGIVYIPNKQALHSLMPLFAEMGGKGHTDMRIFGRLRQQNRMQDLPTIPADYPGMVKMNAAQPSRFAEHVDEFESIFDGAALGQYLGGIDPIHCGVPKPGFVNWNSVFDPRHFEYSWEVDEQGRYIPYLHFTGRKYRINNLHIHSKELEKFTSD